MLANNQYINILLSVFFLIMVLFMLLARQMINKIELNQKVLVTNIQ